MTFSDLDTVDLKSAEALYRFQQITDHRISPDGQHIVYCVQRVDSTTEKKLTDLWVVSTSDRSQNRRFTWADCRHSQPRWSPDGTQIAFVSNRKDETQMQLYVLPFAGGEAQPITDLKGQFGRIEWSPDGSRLLFNFRKKDAAVLEREEDETKKKLGVTARHITRVWYKADALGYLPEEKWHIWTVNVATGATAQLTDGTFNELGPTWAPDGNTILFSSNRNPDQDFNIDDDKLYTIPANGGEMSVIEISNHPFQKSSPVYSPDGSQIAYIGRELALNWWQNSDCYVVSAAGGAAHNISSAHDLSLFGPTASDVHGGVPTSGLVWSPSGDALYATATRHGDQQLVRLGLDGSAETLVKDGGVGTFNFSHDHSQLAYWFTDWQTPSQLRLQVNDSTTPLTDLNPWLHDLPSSQVEALWFDTKDGAQIQGWIVYPPDFDAAQSYPSILQIHGGPQTQDGNTYSHEFSYLAANGYIVYICNPRGSQGYGREHTRAIHGQFGQTIDFEDVMAFADLVEARPYIDSERMGITGGSYGGLMTATVIGRTDRFKAAVVQRMVSNWASMHGSCDFNWGWTALAGVPHPWEDPELNWRQSPMSRVANIKTPSLIIHSEQDLRTPQEQGEQFYVALKVLGVPTELVLFPQEGHGLSRIGRTDRRVARLTHMLRWFDQYLKTQQ